MFVEALMTSSRKTYFRGEYTKVRSSCQQMEMMVILRDHNLNCLLMYSLANITENSLSPLNRAPLISASPPCKINGTTIRFPYCPQTMLKPSPIEHLFKEIFLFSLQSNTFELVHSLENYKVSAQRRSDASTSCAIPFTICSTASPMYIDAWLTYLFEDGIETVTKVSGIKD